MPMLRYSVAITSWKWTGRSVANSPSRLVAPITCPVFMPPPASKAQLTLGQWSRPAPLLILGVRPNSPQAMTVRIFEHAAGREVFDQGTKALIELAAVIAHQVEIVTVAVPATVAERHAADARPRPAGGRPTTVR